MERIPVEIKKQIAQFLHVDRDRRQLRVASIEWFNIIVYDNFIIYLTKKSEWQQIVDRFEKYDGPISLSLRKNIMTNPNDLFEHLTRLTNLTSFDIDKLEAFSEWHKITILSNLKSVPSQCKLWRGKIWKKLPKLEKFAMNHKVTYDEMTDLLNTLTDLRDLTVKLRSSKPLKGFARAHSKLTRLKMGQSTVTKWDNADVQKLQHLKSLAFNFHFISDEKLFVSLKHLTALERLQTSVPISDAEDCSNLTALDLSDYEEPSKQCFAHLQNLKELKIWWSYDENTEYLTSLTSLEKLAILYFEPLSYSVLGNIRSTRLTHLNLGGKFDMSYFSRLGSLLDLKMKDNVFDENIVYLERLTQLSISMEHTDLADYPALDLLSRLTNLRKLTCVGNVSCTKRIDLSPLTNLEYLDIDNFHAPYFGLKDQTKITTLRINCKPQRPFNLLAQIPLIREECREAHADAIHYAKQMTNLRDLTIHRDEQGRFDFPYLEGLTNLSKLILHGFFSIGYVTCLSALQFLEYKGVKPRDLDRLPNLRERPKLYYY